MNQGTVTDHFSREILALRDQELPPEVISYCRILLLDFCGNLIAGADAESAKLARVGLRHVPTGDYAVAGGDGVALPEYAALLNAVAAHSLEMDDIQNRSSIHIGVVVLPALLAAAQVRRLTGRDAMRAMVAGYQVAGRIGRAINPAAHYARGFHPTSTCGAYAAAAASGYALHLSQEQTRNALSLASIGSAGLLQFLSDGSLIKRLHAGWASHSGIMATMLAEGGYTGPAGVIEGSNGFLRAYSENTDVEIALSKWDPQGDEVMNTAIKPYATCRYNQSPLEGVIQLVAKYDLAPGNIERITIHVMPVAWRIVADPIGHKRAPKSIVDAQFSLPFAASVAAIYRRGGLAEHTEEIISGQNVRELMTRVECLAEADLERDYPAKWPARVEIKTRDGELFTQSVDYARGDPENPFSWEDVVLKFQELTREYDQKKCERIINLVESFETTDDFGGLPQAIAEVRK